METKPDSIWNLNMEQVEAEIERIKAAGVPPPGDPGRGRYMTLHRVLRGGSPGARTPTPPTREEQLLARLYSDTDIPVNDIAHGMHVAKSTLGAARVKLKVPARSAIVPFRPSAHMEGHEELTTVDGEPVFRDLATGKTRPVWPEHPLEEPVKEPAAEEVVEEQLAMIPEPTPEPVSPKEHQPRRWRHWTPEQQAEIVRLYIDPSIPLHEIEQAYDIGTASILRFATALGAPPRRPNKAQKDEPRVKGRIAQVDGRWRWVPYEEEAAVQPEVAHEPVAQVSNGLAQVPEVVSPPLVPTPGVPQRTWYVSFTVSRTQFISGSSIDAALAGIREQYGEDVDIVTVSRA